MLINKAEIDGLIPHAGSMCLLDTVTEWDGENIVCLSITHRDATNPLCRQGRLLALHAFEYGAQAVAIHGGLLARTAQRRAPPGYLAALRHAHLYVAYLDDIAKPLKVSAKRLLGGKGNSIYDIWVSAGDRLLAEARVTIITPTDSL